MFLKSYLKTHLSKAAFLSVLLLIYFHDNYSFLNYFIIFIINLLVYFITHLLCYFIY